MEIDANTTGAEAASVLINSISPQTSTTPSALTAEQQSAVQAAVSVLLAQAAIGAADPVEIHLASSPEGQWAVLRVAVVREG